MKLYYLKPIFTTWVESTMDAVPNERTTPYVFTPKPISKMMYPPFDNIEALLEMNQLAQGLNHNV